MRIACLVTVCAALSTLHIAETAHSERQPRSEDLSIQSNIKNATTVTTDVTPSTIHPDAVLGHPHSNMHRDTGKKSRRVRQNHSSQTHHHSSSNRSKRRRPRRGLQRLNARTYHLGRSFDVNENQLETIQSPESFDEGAIHIEPVYRVTKKKNIIDSLIDLVRKVIDPPKPLGPLVGPLHFPGVGDKVYVRLIEPVQANHLVIRLVSQLPYPEIEAAFNQNLLPAHGIAENPEIEHHPLTHDALSSSSNHLRHNAIPVDALQSSGNNVLELSPHLNTGNPAGSGPSDALHTSRTFMINSQYGESQRIPVIVQTVTRPRRRFPVVGGHPKAVRHRNKNRPAAFGSDEQAHPNAPGALKEQNKSQQPFRPSKLIEPSVYIYHPEHYGSYYQGPAGLKSLVNGSDEGAPKLVDSEAEGSLSPLYVANLDAAGFRPVTRHGRVVPGSSNSQGNSITNNSPSLQNSQIQKFYNGAGALHVIKAPALQVTRAPFLPTSFSAVREIASFGKKIREDNSNGSTEEWKPIIPGEKTNASRVVKHTRNSSVSDGRGSTVGSLKRSVPANSSRTWEASTVNGQSVERNGNRTTRKINGTQLLEAGKASGNSPNVANKNTLNVTLHASKNATVNSTLENMQIKNITRNVATKNATKNATVNTTLENMQIKNITRNVATKNATKNATVNTTLENMQIKNITRNVATKNATKNATVKDTVKSTLLNNTAKSTLLNNTVKSILLNNTAKNAPIKNTTKIIPIKNTTKITSIKNTTKITLIKNTTKIAPIKMAPKFAPIKNTGKNAMSHAIKNLLSNHSTKNGSQKNATLNILKNALANKTAKNVLLNNAKSVYNIFKNGSTIVMKNVLVNRLAKNSYNVSKAALANDISKNVSANGNLKSAPTLSTLRNASIQNDLKKAANSTLKNVTANAGKNGTMLNGTVTVNSTRTNETADEDATAEGEEYEYSEEEPVFDYYYEYDPVNETTEATSKLPVVSTLDPGSIITTVKPTLPSTRSSVKKQQESRNSTTVKTV